MYRMGIPPGTSAAGAQAIFRVGGVVMTENRLDKDDQARVDKYLGAESRQQERAFRTWRLLLVIWLVLGLLSGVSYWLALSHGVI